MEDIHGHELINLIAQQNKELTLAEIKKLAIRVFGEDVIYQTCSVSDMTTDDLINFLLDTQKLVKKDNGYIINQGNICDH